MPDIFVTADQDWLPTEKQLSVWTGPTRAKQHSIAKELIQEFLPLTVAAIINLVDGLTDEAKLTDSQVLVIPQHFHPWAHNPPEIWIDVQCGNGPSGVDVRERRAQIVTLLHPLIQVFFEDHEVTPLYDVECRPLSSSGVSVVNGEVAASWGIPKQ
jgi:hypothetical protein